MVTQSHHISNAHVTRANEITQELTDLYAQLAVLKGSELRTRHAAFQSVLADPKATVTLARESATIAVQHYLVEGIKLQGEIDGLLLGLAHCDRALKYWTVM